MTELQFTCYIKPTGPFDGYYDGDYATSEAALCNLLAGIGDGAFETGDTLQVVANGSGIVLWWHTVTDAEDRSPNNPCHECSEDYCYCVDGPRVVFCD